MPRYSVVIGALLIVIGLAAYLWATMQEGDASITALIPAFLGAPILVLGLIAMKSTGAGARKHLMHGVMVIALLGVAGSLYRPIKLVATGESLTFGLPLIMQLITAALSLILLVLGIQSFIAARRAN